MSSHVRITLKPILEQVYKKASQIEATIAEGITHNFHSATDSTGSQWAPRKKAYPHPPLRKTRKLMHDMSATHEISRESITFEQVAEAAYGGYHQWGTRKMVSRPFMGLQTFFRDKILDEVIRV